MNSSSYLKKLGTSILILFISFFSINCAKADTCTGNVTIPDAAFKAKLVANKTINTNGDTEIQCTEAAAYSGIIDVEAQGISSLTGIEAFTALTDLNCFANPLISLDVSKNTALTHLDCGFSLLTSLDVTKNTALTYLNCHTSKLTELNISKNTALTYLNCGNNQLTSLNVKNGNNTILTGFDATNNPGLTCIVVDDAAWSSTHWTGKDATASYNEISCAVVTIPDAVFKAKLVENKAINTNGDAEIQCTEAAAYTGNLSLFYGDIKDLTGIEAFTAITYLSCEFLPLTSLDISKNTALTYLDCRGNELTELDVSKNTALTYLDCWFNKLTSIDVTKNTALTSLNCHTNMLTSLDVTKNTALSYLKCDNNQLASLDVTKNTALTVLDCCVNKLTSLDVTKNTALIHLDYEGNKLTSLDVTKNTALTYLDCHANMLTSLDVTKNTALTYLDCCSNQLTSLNVENGNNTILTTFNATNNPGLTCILVDDAAWSSTHWTNKDAWASYNEISCAIVTIPDARFKAKLVANTAINTNGDTEIEYFEAAAYSGIIDVEAQGISSLTGIEAFTALTQLNCYANSLTSLDVSKNTALTKLDCGRNTLTSLNVSNNTALTNLFCDNISLTSLNVSNNTALTYLFCPYNSLTSLDVSKNTSLTVLGCSNNSLTNLNVKNGSNTLLTTFDATNNPELTCIQVDNAAWSSAHWTNKDAGANYSNICGWCAVTIPDANFKAALVENTAINTNGDAEIQCTEAIAYTGSIDVNNKNISDLTGIEEFTALTQLNCSANLLTHLDISKNTLLSALGCSNNSLTSLDVSKNTALVELDCSNDSLASLDLTTNIDLQALYCSNNSLTGLDLSTNTILTWLVCNNNTLTSLDVSTNTALAILYCNDNQLTSLNVKNGNNTVLKTFNATNNPGLTCIQSDDAAWSTTNWSNKDVTASYNTICGWCTVTIPNANFKSVLLENTAINTNLDTEIQCSEAAAYTGGLDVRNKTISDLTGIEAFTALTSLDCSQNQLTSLDVSKNTALTYLGCSNNLLTSLDVSKNTSLMASDCSNNLLMSLNVKNGYNTTINNFNATNNPGLTCIQVDNATWSTTNWSNKDVTASYNTICDWCTVTIPDANFKAALLNNIPSIDTNNDGVIQCTEAAAYTGSIDVVNLDISDLTGIEAFTAITSLNCSDNYSLTSLDLSKNISLTELNCSYNSLSDLDISKNILLSGLDCSYNHLASLDISKNTSLTILDCHYNTLTSLDISTNTFLTELVCYHNLLKSLDVSKNAALTKLWCFDNQLTSLNVKNGHNTLITNFMSHNNPDLTCIQADDATWSTTNWTVKDAWASYSNDCGYDPVITSISPTNGLTTGGTTVTITGTYFSGITSVNFGANTASITANTDTQITAVSPSGPAGVIDITATTSGGTSTINSADQFSYYAASVATTNAATSITTTGATLNGTINANNASTAVTFQYGLTTGYGTNVTASQSPVTGISDTPVSYALSGLAPNTTYHYRVVGLNTAGTTNGLDQTFTTLQPEVPVDLAVADTTIATGEACFDATNEITVSTVTVANNASANFIAGYSVTFLPGFHAANGSYVRAWITEDGSFCDAAGGSSIISLPEDKSVDLDKTKEVQAIEDEMQVKVYPNPNSGQFKIAISGVAEEHSEIKVYNLLGKMVYSGSMVNQSTSEISIGNAIKGLYILKVTTGKEYFLRKISIR
jgi:Leucine-rich repeat (LRR) protein